MTLPDELPFYEDPAFLDAVESQESGGKLTAVSPKGAQGPMQFMPATWEQYGNGGDPFNREDSRAAASRYFQKLSEDFDGDIEKALAGYNAGEGAVRKYGGIPPYKETQKYVPSILAKYEKNKKARAASQPAEELIETEEAEEEIPSENRVSLKSTIGGEEEYSSSVEDLKKIDTADYEETPQGFASALLDTVQDPAFQLLPLADKAGQINTIFNDRNWGGQAYDIVKETMTHLSEGAKPEELPDFNQFLDPVPLVEKDPAKTLEAWKQAQEQKIFGMGISPAIFGNRLDEYLDESIKAETEAYEYRNRGAVSSFVGKVFNLAREGVKGAVSGFTKPIAGLARLSQAEGTADAIESLPEFLGKPPNDFLYVVDSNGRTVKNPDGTAQTRWQQQVSQTIGGIGSLLAGGAALRAAGYGGKAVFGTFFGVNSLTGANDSFKEVYKETGNLSKAYEAAAWNLPAAVVSSLPELAIVSKWANPAIPFLSDFNKRRYIANVMARNAVLGAAGNAGFDVVQQYGETSQTGKPYDVGRTELAAVTGAVPAAGIAGIQSRNVQGRVPPPPPPPAEPQYHYPAVIGERLPAVISKPVQFEMGVPPKTVQLALPDSGIRYGPESRTEYTPSEATRAVTLKLEDFQKSGATQLDISSAEASNIPTEFLNVMGITGAEADGRVILSKKIRYLPKDAEHLEGLEKNLSEIKAELETVPTPDRLPSLYEERANLNAERKNLVEQAAKAEIDIPANMVRLVRERDRLRNAVESARKAHAETSDPEIREILASDIEEATAAFDAFKETENYDFVNKIGTLEDRIKAIDLRLRYTTTDSYLSDLKAREENYKQQLAKRAALNKKAQTAEARLAEETAAAVSRSADQIIGAPKLPGATEVRPETIKVDGFGLVPLNDRWYVLDAQGKVLSKHVYYGDAVDSIKGHISLSTAFVTKQDSVTDRFNLTPAQDTSARVAGIREEAAAELARTNREQNRSYSEAEYAESGGEKPIFTDVKPGSKEAKAVEESQRTGKPLKVLKPAKEKKPVKGTKGKTPKAATPGVTSSQMPEGTMGLVTEDGILSETPDGQVVYSSKPLTTTSYYNQERLSRSKNQRPVGSDYTPPLAFAEDNQSVTKPQEVIDALQGLISSVDKNTKIFVGGRLRKGVLGYLNYGRNYVRLGRFNDLTTGLHEAMHVIDRALIGKWDTQGIPDYSSLPDPVKNAAIDMYETYYPGAVASDLTKISEGFAMFFQHYATGQPYRRTLLDWYNGDFKNTHPETWKSMEGIKNLSFAHYNQTSQAYARSLINRAPGPLSGLKDYWNTPTFIDNWINSDEVLKVVSKVSGNPNIALRAELNKGRARKVADVNIKRELTNIDGEHVDGNTLVQALLPAKGYEDQLELYLVDKRRIAKFNAKQDPGGNVKDSLKNVAEIERMYPQVVLAANNYYAFMDHIMNVVSEASPEAAFMANKIRQENLLNTGTTHGFYIPFQREGKTGGFNPLKKSTGSSRSIVDPVGNIGPAVEALLSRAYSSQLRAELISSASSNAPFNSMGLYFRELTGTARIGAEKQFDATIPKDASPDEKAMHIFGADPVASVDSSDHQIFPMMDGNKVRYFEVDNRLARALSTEMSGLLSNPLMKFIFRPSAQIFRPAATTLRLAFVMKNLIRDTATAYRYVNTGEGSFKDMLNLAGALGNSLIDTASYKAGGGKKSWAAAIDRMGINNSTRFGAAEDVRANLSKTYGKNFLDFTEKTFSGIESIMSSGEEATRQAVMRLEARRLGIKDINQKLTSQQAMELAIAYKRGTTNFQKQGYQARTVNMAVPFFTARIAEMTRLPDDFRRNPGKVATITLGMLAAGIYHAIHHSDQDWYKEMTPEAKLNAMWTTMNIGGQDKMVFVPLDNVSAIGWGLGQVIGSKMHEDPKLPVAYKELALAYFGQHAPLSNRYEILGPVLKEIIQQDNNKDYYFNKPIVPASLQFRDPKYQFNEFTTETAKAIGSTMGWSPLKVDHFIRSLVPAGSDAIQLAERLSGAKPTKEVTAVGILLGAFTKAGSAAGQMDTSRKLFTENLVKFRANKPEESPEEGTVRKGLEKLNRQVSDLNFGILATDDQAARDELRIRQRELLRLGIELSTGSKVRIAPLKEKPAIERQRKQKDKEVKSTAAEKRKSDAGYSLLGDSGE